MGSFNEASTEIVPPHFAVNSKVSGGGMGNDDTCVVEICGSVAAWRPRA